MISRDEAIAKFKQIIGVKAAFIRLAKSQFIEHLAIFVSWALRDALWKLERMIQEFFISTAINKGSILAHVEDREYIPRKRTPSAGQIRITNNGAAVLSLPNHTPFVSDPQVEYVTQAPLTIAPGGYVDVAVRQCVKQTIEMAVTEEKSFLEVLFAKDVTAKLAGFDVYVDSGDGYELWSYAQLFQNTWPDSKAYDEFYTHAGQSGIRFGNGQFGLIPLEGSTIKVDLWLTEGDTSLLEGQEIRLLGTFYDNSLQPADVTAVTLETITGGSEAEPLEETKVNLHYWPIYNNKLVWSDDYSYFLKKQLPDIVWINCWGEEEMEAAYGAHYEYMNKVFIAAYAPGNPDLDVDVLAALGTIHLLNRKFQWITPEFATFTVAVTGKVGKTVVVPDAIQAIKDALTVNYSKDSAKRKTLVAENEIYETIRKTGYFVAGTQFSIAITGTISPTQLHEMVHIDIDASTVALTYIT